MDGRRLAEDERDELSDPDVLSESDVRVRERTNGRLGGEKRLSSSSAVKERDGSGITTAFGVLPSEFGTTLVSGVTSADPSRSGRTRAD